ncbi:MAG: hypothetical protein M1821_009712 [Bathelium mastoideum]|nr:MAG: hypothetical protein M1821_009712 [Bathelium mastoideum]
MAKDQIPSVQVQEQDTNETTPLLRPPSSEDRKKWTIPTIYRLLFCAFIVSLTFGVTQVPLMTCDAYYEKHPLPRAGSDRCAVPEIEAGTARAVALVGASTTFFGVANLFVTGWTIKKFGVKAALLISVFWPAVRLAVQNIGVMTGSSLGILIVQCSQIITITGGPVGYMLALNTFVAEVVQHRERTGALGRLQGCAMFGMATGYLVGGILSDSFGILAPFRVTLALFMISSIYVLLFLPWVPANKAEPPRSSQGLARFFGPLKTLFPRKWVMSSGRIKREYGALVLAAGAFSGVLATAYVPTMLQMYSTDMFGFGTTENSYLVSMHALIRGFFLTFMFPRIISMGRRWLEKKDIARSLKSSPPKDSSAPNVPDNPNEIPAPQAIDQAEEPIEPPKLLNEQETFDFDLVFTKISLLADGLLTGAASLVGKGWQLYIVAAFLPFASGSGAAAKGTILQMCLPSERTDALSAITLVEMIARLLTTFVFGLIFAAFANIGKLYLVFVCNAGVAVLGFCVLLLSRFPPAGSRRLDSEQNDDTRQEA